MIVKYELIAFDEFDNVIDFNPVQARVFFYSEPGRDGPVQAVTICHAYRGDTPRL